MNKLTILFACFIFAVGALAGRWTVEQAAAMGQTQIQPLQMMETAYALPVESYDTI